MANVYKILYKQSDIQRNELGGSTVMHYIRQNTCKKSLLSTFMFKTLNRTPDTDMSSLNVNKQ